MAEFESLPTVEQQYHTIKRLRALLRQCDEAMSWDLGGEPLPSLMIAARKAILEELGPAPSALPQSK